MDNCCRICKLIFRNEVELHRHFRSHKITIEDYYTTYFPRKDLLTNELITFKSKEFYFGHDFNTKTNMLTWLKKQDLEVAKKYCTEILKRRKDEKELVYTPSQVELRTTMFPSVGLYNKFVGDYYLICEQLGFKNKYGSMVSAEGTKKEIEESKHDGVIVVDTREQTPFSFDCPTKSHKLDYGDYQLESNGAFVIERKTLKDFVATFSNGYQRVTNEIERASAAGASIVVLVEQSLNDCLSFPFLPYLNVTWRITPDFVFHNVRELIQKFANLQFLFVRNKTTAQTIAEKLLFSKGLHLNYDLQFLYDEKILL